MENIIDNLPIEYYNHSQLIILTKSGKDFVFISNYKVLVSSWVKPTGSLYSIIDKNLELVKQNISMQEIYEENYQILSNNEFFIKQYIGQDFGCQALAWETLRFSKKYLTELGIEQTPYFLTYEQANAQVMLLKKNDSFYLFFRDSGFSNSYSRIDNYGDVYLLKTKDEINIKRNDILVSVVKQKFEEFIIDNNLIVKELKKLKLLTMTKKYFKTKIKELEYENSMCGGGVFGNTSNGTMRDFFQSI